MKRIVSPRIRVLLLNLFLFGQVYAYTSKNTSNAETPLIYKYIFNGLPTITDEFPFMAALGWTNNETDKIDYLAGGMLITPNFILTAAHCVFYNGKLPNIVTVGGNGLNSYYNELHEVKDFFLHPEYDENQAYNDIALLQLAKTSGKPPLCIWIRPTLYTKNVTAVGYGATKFAGLRTDELLKVKLTVFPEKKCEPYFRRQRKFRTGIWHSHLCAGDIEGMKDTCQGDSGGPLLVEFDNQTYAAGITSIGQACSGLPPAVYTRISSFVDWIDEILVESGSSMRKTCEAE